MRSYNDYKNQQISLEEKAMQAARNGDFKYFSNLGAQEQNQILALKDSKGYSPLMLASYHGHLDVAALLLSWGGDANDSDFGGNTLLMGAAFKGHCGIVRLLLSHGADADLTNDKGLSAALYAQMFGREDVLRILRKNPKTNFNRKLRAWFSFFKMNLVNERKQNV